MSCSAPCNRPCRHEIKPAFAEHDQSQQRVGRINLWQQLWIFSILLVLFKGSKIVASTSHPTSWQDAGDCGFGVAANKQTGLFDLAASSSLLSSRSHYHSLHTPHGWGRHTGRPDCYNFSWQALLCWLFSLPEEPAGNRLLFDPGQKGCRFLSELLPKQQQHSFLSEKGRAGLFCSCLFFLHEILGFLEAAAKIFYGRMSRRKTPCSLKEVLLVWWVLCQTISNETVVWNIHPHYSFFQWLWSQADQRDTK